MNARKLTLGALAGAVLLAAAPAWAGDRNDRYDRHDRRDHGRHDARQHAHERHRYVPPRHYPHHYYRPAPQAHYYYAPPRAVIVPRPLVFEFGLGNGTIYYSPY